MRILLFASLLFAGCAFSRPDDEEFSISSHGQSVLIKPAPKSLAGLPNEKLLPLVDPGFSGEHPLEFYVQFALQRNPGIRAAERRVAAATDEVPQVTALPDPMLENVLAPIPQNSIQTAGGRMVNSLTVSQRFPWVGKLAARGRVAEREAQIALTELAEEQLKVAEAVKTSYYELLYFQNATRITKDNEQFLKQYLALAESQYRVGKASQQDLLRAQVELSRLQDQLIQLSQQFQTAQADLARLLSVSPNTDVRPSGGVPPTTIPERIDELFQIAIAERPDLKGRLMAIDRDREKLQLARLEYYPDVNVGVNWGAMTANQALARTADGIDNIGFGIGINLPIRHERLQAGVRQASARVAESAWRYEAARDDTLRDIRRLSVQARALEQQIKLLKRDIIPRAEQTLKTSEADYRVGKVESLTVIDNFTELLRFQIQLARFESMLGQSLASLERAVGVELARPVRPMASEPRSPPKDSK